MSGTEVTTGASRVTSHVARLLMLAFIIHHPSLITAAHAQPNRRDAYCGYAYPAGAQQGTSLRVLVGGQGLQAAKTARFSGTGVRATVVDYGRPLSRKQLGDLGMRLKVLMQARLAEAVGQGAAGKLPRRAQAAADEPLPDHPALRDLEKKTLSELDAIRRMFFDRKKQPNTQIGEMVWMDVVVEPTAAPGVRELRLESPGGLSNPVRFVIGSIPEAVEQEPNSREADLNLLNTPVVVNGQLAPGDTDFCRFTARQGQKLIITAQARSLIPYLADAVPGWCQATLTLYDANGAELAYGDDCRSEPDPVLYYEVPRDGEYALEIHDAIFRGRDDFIYRITIAEQPFITSIFPLGGQVGSTLTVALTGWNLPAPTMQLDTQRVGGFVLEPAPSGEAAGSGTNPPTRGVAYAVDSLPEALEQEPNDAAASAQTVIPPQIINGRIARPGDVDAFRFEGRGGDQIVAEVQARRLGSPLDSLLRLIGPDGQAVAVNDDHPDPTAALQTHHADSYILTKLPKDGAYTVLLSDAQGHGGDEHAYRLRLGPPQPDFGVRITPSGLKIPAGRTVPLTAHALRKDGFAGEIELAIAGPPAGFTISGGRIPAGHDKLHLTLTAPLGAPGDWDRDASSRQAVQVVGKATIGNQTVTHAAVPADDMMQAFAYRHLVPAQEFVVLVGPSPRWAPILHVTSASPVRIPSGGTAQVQVRAPAAAFVKSLRIEINSAPEGVALKAANAAGDGFALVLAADKTRLKPGPTGNLILEAFVDNEVKRGNGKTARVRASLGILPAVPMEVVP